MKIIKLIIFLVVSVSSTLLQIKAQSVGINTLTPRATLEVKGAGNTSATKAVRVVNSDNIEILTMLDDGRLGLGNVSPSVRLDLRGTSDNPIIALGTTDATASTAGAGAIRYMEGSQVLEFSDGDQWFHLKSSAKRACLLAVNNYVGGTYATNQTLRLLNYSVDYDSHNAFDASISEYTAPINGLYIVSFSALFDDDDIPDNSYVEGKWVSSNGRMLQAIEVYPEGGDAKTKVTCSGTIYLRTGDKLWPEIWHNMGGDRTLRAYGSTSANPSSDIGFNYLSIAVQEIY